MNSILERIIFGGCTRLYSAHSPRSNLMFSGKRSPMNSGQRYRGAVGRCPAFQREVLSGSSDFCWIAPTLRQIRFISSAYPLPQPPLFALELSKPNICGDHRSNFRLLTLAASVPISFTLLPILPLLPCPLCTHFLQTHIFWCGFYFAVLLHQLVPPTNGAHLDEYYCVLWLRSLRSCLCILSVSITPFISYPPSYGISCIFISRIVGQGMWIYCSYYEHEHSISKPICSKCETRVLDSVVCMIESRVQAHLREKRCEKLLTHLYIS